MLPRGGNIDENTKLQIIINDFVSLIIVVGLYRNCREDVRGRGDRDMLEILWCLANRGHKIRTMLFKGWLRYWQTCRRRFYSPCS